MMSDLFVSYRDAVREALGLAALAALIVAAGVSVVISRQVISPIQQMKEASQRIAEGHYDERVEAHVNPKHMDELDQLAISFNRMAAEMEQTETMRQRLIGDVAHELRTPLTTIKGTAEALIDNVLPANLETFHKLYREADRLQRLVADLQELSRVEAGAYTLEQKPVSIHSLVSEVVERLESQFADKGVTLIIELPDRLQPVLADRDRIGQVLLNLVGNALQYTPAQGAVAIRAVKQKDVISIAVSDTGIGIPAEHLSRLFTRFYRVDKSRSRAAGGSGIGLTISKHLVEAHGGEIYVNSPGPDQGSTFTFTLPVVH